MLYEVITAIARGLSRFSAMMVTKSLLVFEWGSGNEIGSDGEVKTSTEKTTEITMAMIWIFLSMKIQSFEIILITFKNLIKRIYVITSYSIHYTKLYDRINFV